MAVVQRSSNPAFSDKIFSAQGSVEASQAMTIQGTVNKSLILSVLVIASASFTWSLFNPENPTFSIWGIVGGIGGTIAALVAIFKPTSSPISAPIYAVMEGLFLGSISAFFEMMYPGIAFQAVLLTMATLFTMLFLYKGRIIRVTDKLRSGIIAATGAIALVYIISILMSLFGAGSIPMLHESSPMGIGFSLLVVGIAAFNLLLDFDFIENGARHGAPKYMEWFSSFGLMLTLIWLYMEILRLLAKLRD